MISPQDTLFTILMASAIVYLTRAGGYFIGIQLRHIPGIQPVLETLPGCAMMAILAPSIRQGSLTEVVSLVCVLGIMWFTNNVIVATVSGVLILLFVQL